MANISALVVDCDWVCDCVVGKVESFGIATTLESAGDYVLYVLETHAWSPPREWMRTLQLCSKLLFCDIEKFESEELYLMTTSLLRDIMTCVEVIDIRQIEHDGVVFTLTGSFEL